MRWLKTYRNSTTVAKFNGYDLKVEDIILACLLGRINVLLVSERGEGKTQILHDVLYGIFNERGNYVRCTPDMEIKDIFTAINLEKLREKTGTTEDILDVTKALENPFTAIDELNRAPPIIQNQLLQILDGYLEVKGKRYPLGIPIDDDYYHVSIATINIGSRRYLGTFGIDVAILDRFGVVLDLDYYHADTNDVFEILLEPRGSTLRLPERKDLTNEIVKLYKLVSKEWVPLEVYIATLFLREGVDYISMEPFSQRKVRGELPDAHELGGIQGIMRPISIRTAKQIIQLYRALSVLTKKIYGASESPDDYFNNFLEILPFVIPFSGALRSSIVNSQYFGNPIIATHAIQEILNVIFNDNLKYRFASLAAKLLTNKLTSEDLITFTEEFSFIRELFEREISESESIKQSVEKHDVEKD